MTDVLRVFEEMEQCERCDGTGLVLTDAVAGCPAPVAPSSGLFEPLA